MKTAPDPTPSKADADSCVMLRDTVAQVSDAACLGCGYSLVALDNIRSCPECGHAFDLADPSTFGPARIRLALKIAAFKPNWIVTATLLAAAGLTILTGSGPGGSYHDGWVFLLPAGLMLAVLVWIGAFSTHVLARRRLHNHRINPPPWTWHWAMPPLLAALVWYGIQHAGVWEARWWLSKDSFTELAQTPRGQWTTGRIGLFYITSVTADPTGTMRLELGFPDWHSDLAAELQFGDKPVSFAPTMSLGNGWWLCWDPT